MTTCPRPDGLWLPTLDLPLGAVTVVGPDGAAWTLTPVTEGGWIASSPTFSDNVGVTAIVDYGNRAEAIAIPATPGCGLAAGTTIGTLPPVPGAVAPPSASTASTVGEPSTTIADEAARERSGLGGLVFILGCIVVAVVALIVRSTWRDSRRPIGPTSPVIRAPLPDPGPPTSPPWTPGPPATRSTSDRTPTVSEPAAPPTTFDSDDPAVERYAADVAAWLRRS